jgi:hypothetical protein
LRKLQISAVFFRSLGLFWVTQEELEEKPSGRSGREKKKLVGPTFEINLLLIVFRVFFPVVELVGKIH